MPFCTRIFIIAAILDAAAFLFDKSQSLRIIGIVALHVGLRQQSVVHGELPVETDGAIRRIERAVFLDDQIVFREAIGDAVVRCPPAEEGGYAGEDVVSLLRDGLSGASDWIYRRAVEKRLNGCGSTFVGVVFDATAPAKATAVHAGDSRLYRISGDAIERVTRDHSVVEDMIQRGKITREESRTHPNKNLITRAVGTAAEVRSDVFTLTIKPGDRLLLCSDGLSNMFEDDEMLKIVNSAETTDDAAAELMRKALDGGAPDNVTLVLFQA